LESPPVKDGLNLLETLQSALAPLTHITVGIIKALAVRNRNMRV